MGGGHAATPVASAATRRARWLLTAYTKPEWQVQDSHGGADTVTLSFKMRMPDGRCLTDWKEFYCAVKEFAFFIRDGRYSQINDAGTHTAYVYALMDVCHALALEGFTSFKHVTSKVLNSRFLKRLALGGDALIKASERAGAWLSSRDLAPRRGFQDGLPLLRRADGTVLKILDNGRLMGMMGLPTSACKLPRVAYLCNEASRLAGLLTQSEIPQACPPYKTVTVSTLHRYLNGLDMLYRMRAEIDAVPLPDRPFHNPPLLARRLGVETTPTPTPPPGLALHLLSHAMLWVTNYSDSLVGLLRRAEVATSSDWADRDVREKDFAALVEPLPKEGPCGCPWPLLPRTRARMSPGLACESAIRFLFTACLIVIAAFSARRKEELAGLEVGDLWGSDADGWWLNPYIEKTLQRKDWIPVPKVVARAFEVLVALSSTARRESGSQFVFQWWNPFETNPRVITGGVRDGDAIDEFADWVKTPMWERKGRPPERWHWSLHQFRKFFAVLYFYRYRGATIEVLANFLRHFNLEMTRQYLLRNKDLKEVFEAVEWNYTLDISTDIVTKGAASKRGMGKMLLKQWTGYLRRALRVTGQVLEEAKDYVARQFKTRKAVITPLPWADCTCPRTVAAGKNANCRSTDAPQRREAGPNHEQSGPSVCADCCFCSDNGRLEELLAEEALRVGRSSASELLAGSILSEIAQARVLSVAVYKDCKGSSEMAHE